MRKKRRPKDPDSEQFERETEKSMDSLLQELFHFTPDQVAELGKPKKNQRRAENRRVMREALARLDAGDREQTKALLRQVSSSYLVIEWPDDGPYVGHCDYCQHLVSEHSECIDHPRKPVSEEMEKLYRSFDNIEEKYALDIYRKLLEQIARSGVPLVLGASLLDTPASLLGNGHGYPVNAYAEPTYRDRMPRRVPEDLKEWGTLTGDKLREFMSKMDPESRKELPEDFGQEQVEVQNVEQFVHIWNYCEKTRQFLVDKDVDPLTADIKDWSRILFIGDRKKICLPEIDLVLKHIASNPALAAGLVVRSEVWIELREKLRNRVAPGLINMAVEYKEKHENRHLTIGQVAGMFRVKRSTLKSRLSRRQRG